MDLVNFNLSNDFVALEHGELYFDLHNNFSFVELSYDVAKRELTFKFVRRNESWVSPNDPKKLEIQSHGVNFFKIKERDKDEPYSEDDCLSNIGFIYNDLIDEVEGFSKAEPSDDANHLNICFQPGFAIKIASESALLKIKGSD